LVPSCRPEGREAAIGKEKASIKGAWRPSSMTILGRALDKDDLDTFKIVIGDSTILIQGKILREESSIKKEYSYWLNPTTDPKQIDLAFNGTMGLGIYKVEGDTLSIRWGGKAGRPSDFVAGEPGKYELYVLKREGPGDDNGSGKK
jgi:uncharacterized protein (TIGR03067 family)